jgi:uncharacterized small protein (DUF1192 family)
MSDDLLKRRLIGTGHGSSFEAVRRIDDMADEITRLRAEVERQREAERTAWIAGRDAAAVIAIEVASYGSSDDSSYDAGRIYAAKRIYREICALTPEATP